MLVSAQAAPQNFQLLDLRQLLPGPSSATHVLCPGPYPCKDMTSACQYILSTLNLEPTCGIPVVPLRALRKNFQRGDRYLRLQVINMELRPSLCSHRAARKNGYTQHSGSALDSPMPHAQSQNFTAGRSAALPALGATLLPQRVPAQLHILRAATCAASISVPKPRAAPDQDRPQLARMRPHGAERRLERVCLWREGNLIQNLLLSQPFPSSICSMPSNVLLERSAYYYNSFLTCSSRLCVIHRRLHKDPPPILTT